MECSVVAVVETHLPSVYEVINTVAREQRFLNFTQLPPWEQSLAFYRNTLNADFPFFVALAAGKVVGWCDVAPLAGQSRAHIGTLGVGLLPEARHQGLGAQLMRAAIAKAWSRGLTRIELTVRDDNLNAKALYERLGFEQEGVLRKGSVVGDECHDLFAMALLNGALLSGETRSSDSVAPARKPVVLGPGEGRSYPMGRISAIFKADEAETASSYSISEWWLEPHTQGPGAHSHPEDDVFYVIEGTMSVLVGDAWTHASQGSFVLIPGGLTHDFENRSDARAGVLNLSVPGAFEPHMTDIAQWFAEHPPGDA